MNLYPVLSTSGTPPDLVIVLANHVLIGNYVFHFYHSSMVLPLLIGSFIYFSFSIWELHITQGRLWQPPPQPSWCEKSALFSRDSIWTIIDQRSCDRVSVFQIFWTNSVMQVFDQINWSCISWNLCDHSVWSNNFDQNWITELDRVTDAIHTCAA